MDTFFFGRLIVVSLITSVMVYTGVPKVISISKLKKLFDNNKEEHKTHSGLVPNIGGIVLVIAFVIGLAIKPSSAVIPGFNYLIAALLVLFIAGVKDDLLVISPSKKLIAQFLAATLIIFGAGLTVTSFGGVFGIHELTPVFSVVVTYAVFIVMINAINLLDGIDGLAASVTTLAALLFSSLFYITGQSGLFVCCIILAVVYSTFLFHNWSPAKIYMGDTGSLTAGFLLAFTGIHFLNTGISMIQTSFWQTFIPIILVSILILPLYDTLRIIFVRLANGKSPLHPDNDHVHHHLTDIGFTHGQSTSILILINVLIVLVAFVGSYFVNSVNTLLVLIIISSCLLLPTVSIKRKFISVLMPDLFINYNTKGVDKKDEEGSEAATVAKKPIHGLKLVSKKKNKSNIKHLN